MSDLTDKQRRFCEEYVIDFNATRAALEAGYSEKTAYSIGHQNLKKVEIQTFIKEIQKDLSKLSGVTALRNILELKKVAYANISDLMNDWDSLKNFDVLTDDQRAIILEVTNTKVTFGDDGVKDTTKLKLHDKLKAIESLNKMLGFNAVEKKGITIEDKREELTPQEVEARLKEVQEEMKRFEDD